MRCSGISDEAGDSIDTQLKAQKELGWAMVPEIIEDLLASGYDGFAAIEPHIAAVVHTGESSDPETTYRTYVEYGRRLNAIVAAAREKVTRFNG